MQNVSKNYLDFINDASNIGRNMRNKVVIDNVEYFSDTIKSNPKISHKATSFIGGFPAKTCEFEILNLDGSLSLNNKEIEVYKGLEGTYPEIKMIKDETTGKYYLDGISTQETTNGYQLVDFANAQTTNTADYTFNNDILIVDSTNKADKTYNLVGYNVLPLVLNNRGKTLYFKATSLDLSEYTSTNGAIVTSAIVVDGKTSYSTLLNKNNATTGWKIPETGEITGASIRVMCNNTSTTGTPSIVKIIEPRLSFTQNALYEQYTGGLPMPNPNYPSEIINKYKAGTYRTQIEGKWYKITISEDLKGLQDGVADRLWVDIDDLSIECTRAVKNIVLNGNEKWLIANNVFYTTSISDYISSLKTICISDCYLGINNVSGTAKVTQNNTCCFYLNNSSLRFYVRDERFTTVDEFKAYLNENNVNLYYALATPIEETTTQNNISTDTTEWVKMGIFKAKDEDITTNLSTKSISFKGTDRRTLFDEVYSSDLAYPATGLQIIQDICSKKGVTLETTNFNMANYTFTKKPNFSEATTFTEAIARMAEAGGEIAFISRNGGLRIVGQTKTNQTIPKSKRSSLTKEKQFGAINTVVLGMDGYDDDIVYPAEIAVDRIEWKITNNPYFDLNREEIIETIANNIIGKSVIPYTIDNFVDDFIYDLNDVVSAIDNDGNSFDAVILQYETASRIKSNIAVPAQTETTTNYNAAGNKNSNNIAGSVKLIVNHLEKVVEAIAQKIVDTSEYIKTINGQGTLHLENTAESDAMIKKLVIKGFAPQPLYLGDKTYLSENTYLGTSTHYCILERKNNVGYTYNEETGELIYDAASYENEELTINDEFVYENEELNRDSISHDIYVSEPLNSGVFNGIMITDDLVIENNKCYVIRRLGLDTNNNLYVLNETITEEYGDVVLSTFKENTYISVEKYSDISFECLYMQKNEYVDYFATEVLYNSNFAITDENINSKVSKDHIISEINQTAELVKILANKIQLEGYTTINGGFAVDLEGNASIANGAVKINKEGIQMATGTKVVGGDGLLTNIQDESDWEWLGFVSNESIAGENSTKSKLKVQTYIPDNFVATQAKITLIHAPIHYEGEAYDVTTEDFKAYDFWGYSRNIRLYQNTDADYSVMASSFSDYDEVDNSSYSEITNAFGANGFTAEIPTNDNYKTQTITSIDFANLLNKGFNEFVLESADEPPTQTGDLVERDVYSKTGRAFAVISIIGYMSI